MEVIKNKKLVSMISNFPSIINKFLGDLPKDDYPVLDTFKFVSCWLSFVIDRSQSSMRDLFKRLNVRGIDMDISTFSKASKNRDPVVFHNLFLRLPLFCHSSQSEMDERLMSPKNQRHENRDRLRQSKY
jgi:hypothetical protein